MTLWSAYVAQIQDEAVTTVEAVPADGHLRRPYGSPAFDLEESLDRDFIGHHMSEARGHTTGLEQKQDDPPSR